MKRVGEAYPDGYARFDACATGIALERLESASALRVMARMCILQIAVAIMFGMKILGRLNCERKMYQIFELY